MDLGGHCVLVTGGGSGIGRALASRFLAAGSTVLVCGRSEAKLREAQEAHPGLVARVCDLADAEERRELARWVTIAYPRLDILINNAGVQRYPRLDEHEPWADAAQEIAINLEAPMDLTRLLVPHLLGLPQAAIANVTSGLAFVPLVRAPIYSATKAALRSFTLSLRHQLAGTAVRVVEIIPPAVDTDLGGPGLHTFGVPVETFVDAVMEGIAADSLEIAYGFAEQARKASRSEFDALFDRMNARN